MRNRIIYIIFLIALFISVDVNAETLSECLENGDCIKLCDYYYYEKNNGIAGQRVVIYYDYENGLGGTINVDLIEHRAAITGKDKTTTYLINQKRIYSEEKMVSSQPLSCPNYVYIDLEYFNEICFANSTNYCYDNYGDKFGGTSELRYNYYNDINNFFNTDILKGKTCKNITLDFVKEDVVNGYSNSILQGKNVPSFLLRNKKYNNFQIERLNKVGDFVNNCIANVSNNSTLSENEKNKKITEYETMLTELGKASDKLGKVIEENSSTSDNSIELNETDCDSIFGVNEPGYPAYYIFTAFNIIKYLAILILIVFTIMDFLKAIISKDEDAINKSVTQFVKRFIIAIIIFLLPTLIELVMEWSGLVDDVAICGITDIQE